jgi:phosphoserine aminotransferase
MFENFKVPSELIPDDPRFGVGPSLIPLEHINKLAQTGFNVLGTSHRQNAIKDLMKEAQSGLKKYFNLPEDYLVAMGNGGATLLFDMIGLGMVEKKSSHFVTGEFSGKWCKSHKLVPWIDVDERKVDFGEGITPEKTDADMLCMTLNETSTVVMIDQVPDKGPNQLVAIDATSGAGQIACDLSKVDVFFFSPQKVFASEGGLWVAILSPQAQERALKIAEDKSRYVPGIMDWKVAIENSRKGQTYNTPSVSTLFLLNEQVKLMNELGHAKVTELAKEKAKYLYDWAQSKAYLSAYIKDEKYRSYCVATIDIDDKIPSADLTKSLRAQNAIWDIDAYRKLGRNQLRISLFHNVSFENLKKLTQIISKAIESEL